jgi:hypothetical protein
VFKFRSQRGFDVAWCSMRLLQLVPAHGAHKKERCSLRRRWEELKHMSLRLAASGFEYLGKDAAARASGGYKYGGGQLVHD